MSWAKKVIFDKRRRILVKKYEKDLLILKFLSESALIKRDTRYLYQFNFMMTKGIWVYKTRIHNRCIWTNKVRWVFRSFKLSRMAFKEAASMRRLMGVRRAKW